MKNNFTIIAGTILLFYSSTTFSQTIKWEDRMNGDNSVAGLQARGWIVLNEDGGGITPDIEMVPEPLSQISTELYLRYLIFDFASQYFWTHPQIKPVDDFEITDSDYEDFHKFLIARNFSYKTVTEESLNVLISNARKEKYYEPHKDLFMELEKNISHNLDQDLKIFRDEISDLLAEEIISRYFYEEGAIAWGIRKDEQVNKAIEILNNREEYNALLTGKTNSVRITVTDEINPGRNMVSGKRTVTEPV